MASDSQGEGALRNDQSALIFEEGFSFSGYERDPLYLNLGEGRFLDVSGVSGIDSISDGRAAVFGDFDNDGDLDVFLTTIQGPTHLLFRNNVGQDGGHLRVSLEGSPATGRDAHGAVVRLRTPGGTLTKIKAGGSGYLSQHDPRLLFGLGGTPTVAELDVTWPGGTRERFSGPFPAGSNLQLRQGSGRAVSVKLPHTRLPDPETRAQSFARGLLIAPGRPLPELAVRDLDGQRLLLGTLARPGRRLLVNVWATWCTPCLREMPELEALRSSLADQGVDLVGLNVDAEPDADVRGFVRRTGARYPMYLGGVDVIARLYATDELSVPLSFIVDATGVVTEIIPGWSVQTRRRFLDLAGQPSKE